MGRHNHLKYVAAGVVLITAVSYLAFAGVQSGWVYYLDVDQFVLQDDLQGRRVRLAGRVADEGVASSSALLTASFDLRGNDHAIPVVYQGVVPDNFKPGCDLVVEGTLDESGVFQADVMLTKCASKYQAEEHAKRLEDAS